MIFNYVIIYLFLAYPRLLPVAISLRIFKVILFPALPFECVFACLWNLVWHVTSFRQWSVRKEAIEAFFLSLFLSLWLWLGLASCLWWNIVRHPVTVTGDEAKAKQNLVLQIWHFGIVGNYNLPKLSCLSQYLFRFWVILYI